MKFNRRRGVSPVIEALLVVGIAIAGVAGFIAYYYGVLGTATKQASVTVEDVALKVGTNGVTVSVTLKNAGTVDLSSQTATLIISGVTVPRNHPRAYPAPLACQSPVLLGPAELSGLSLRGWLRQTYS